MKNYDDAAAAEFYENPQNLTPVGPGRPRKKSGRGLGSHVPVRFPAAIIAAVKWFADRDGVTVSSWIRDVVIREVEGPHRVSKTLTSPGPTLEFTNPRPTAVTLGTPSEDLVFVWSALGPVKG